MACGQTSAPAEAPVEPDGTGVATEGATRGDRVDAFHPDVAANAPALEPRRGGTVVVHLETEPPTFNGLIESAAIVDRVLAELHAYLVRRDPVTWAHEPELAVSWTIEDALVLADGTELYGAVEEIGAGLRITPLSAPGHVLAKARDLEAADVALRRAGTVITMRLRDDVTWHDGHPFDAQDVAFSWRITQNPTVHCDDVRFEYEKIARLETPDDHTVRFFFREPHFLALAVLDGLVILPRHRFDLGDPDNPDRDSRTDGEAAAERQGAYVNEHPANRAWIGLGPYRLDAEGDGWFEARRVDDWFDPDRAGWVDVIRWRVLAPDQAVRALSSACRPADVGTLRKAGSRARDWCGGCG